MGCSPDEDMSGKVESEAFIYSTSVALAYAATANPVPACTAFASAGWFGQSDMVGLPGVRRCQEYRLLL